MMYLSDDATPDELEDMAQEQRILSIPALTRWDLYWQGYDVEIPDQAEIDAETE